MADEFKPTLEQRAFRDLDPRTAGTCSYCSRKFIAMHDDRARSERRGLEMCRECSRQQRVEMFECGRCGRKFTSLDWPQPAAARTAHERDCWNLKR